MVSASSDVDEDPNPNYDAVKARQLPHLATMRVQKLQRRQLWSEASATSPVVRLLIGDALGDAFGFGIEFQDARWIRARVDPMRGEFPASPVLTGEFAENNERGFYSDDTEMTVGLMKALGESLRAFRMHDALILIAPPGRSPPVTVPRPPQTYRLDAGRMLDAWRAEWDLSKQRPPPALPGVGRAGHGGIKYVWKGADEAAPEEKERVEAELLAAMRQRLRTAVDPGNAPPMRALPLAFVEDPAERERLAIANADATHPHNKARFASLGIVEAARFLVVEGNVPQRDIIQRVRARLARSFPSLRGSYDVRGRPAAASTDFLGRVIRLLTSRLITFHWDDPEWSASLFARMTSSKEDGMWKASLAYLQQVDALPDYHAFGPRYANMPDDVHALLCGPQPIPSMRAVLSGDAPGVAGELRGLPADALRTLGSVLYVVKWARGAADALTASVDLGGDVDSVAALSLGIVAGAEIGGGLRFGVDVDGDHRRAARGGAVEAEEGDEPRLLPWSLLEELEGVEYLVRQAKMFESGFVKVQAPAARQPAAKHPVLNGGAVVASFVVLLAVWAASRQSAR